jgi:hypothetical protein
MSSSDVQQHWDAATAAVGIRTYEKLASRTGLRESYVAVFHYSGGCLDPRGMLRIRVNQYRVRATMKAEVFDAWQDVPSEVKRRFLIATEWQRIIESVNASGFWLLPSTHTPSSIGFHRESWSIEGFRDGRIHSVRRTTWNVLEGVGAEVFRLGRFMAQIAGLSVSEHTAH